MSSTKPTLLHQGERVSMQLDTGTKEFTISIDPNKPPTRRSLKRFIESGQITLHECQLPLPSSHEAYPQSLIKKVQELLGPPFKGEATIAIISIGEALFITDIVTVNGAEEFPNVFVPIPPILSRRGFDIQLIMTAHTHPQPNAKNEFTDYHSPDDYVFLLPPYEALYSMVIGPHYCHILHRNGTIAITAEHFLSSLPQIREALPKNQLGPRNKDYREGIFKAMQGIFPEIEEKIITR